MLLQEPLFLPHDPIFDYCDSPLKREDTDRIIGAASFAVKAMLKKNDRTYGKIKLSVYESVFSSKSSIADICRREYPDASEPRLKGLMSCALIRELNKGKRLFFFPIQEDEQKSFGSVYTILPPMEIKYFSNRNGKIASPVKLGPIFSYILNKKRNELAVKVGAAVMKISRNELAFVTRFNEETFFKNVSVKPISSFGITENGDLSAFAALYTIAFHGLSIRDIYTVDEVFSFSAPDIRGKDDVKRQAASELSLKSETASDEERTYIIQKMGQALFELPLPEADTKNLLVLAKNYVFYNAVSDMGNAYRKALDAVSPSPALTKGKEDVRERARLLSDYRYLAELCEEMSALAAAGKTNITAAGSRKKAEAVCKKIRKIRASGEK